MAVQLTMLNKNEGNLLIDYYGSLLTKHQLDILNDYFGNDFSMVEIAENLNISKAAVSDIIKRSVNQLLTYEKNLKCIEKDDKLDKIILELQDGDKKSQDLANKIRKIIER